MIDAVFSLQNQILSMFLGFGSTLVLSVLLVLTKPWHGFLSFDTTHGVQKFHTNPTPRVGGLAVLLGLVASSTYLSSTVQSVLWPFIFAGMPAFLFGFAEDLTKRVGVFLRLFATMFSGFLGYLITGHSISEVDTIFLDYLISFTFISVVFTVIAVSGVANAINIIDGFNGLASITSILAFLGYAGLAWQFDDAILMQISLIFASCLLGFLLINWPFGKLFLGDGGAYFVGFSLAWVAVLLLERNPEISTFSVLIVCVYPVTEVVFSMVRRFTHNRSVGRPDKLHFHSLFKRRYIKRWFAGQLPLIRNSITGLCVGMMTLLSVILAYLTASSIFWSVLALTVLILGYVIIYARMVRFQWCSPLVIVLGVRGILSQAPKA